MLLFHTLYILGPFVPFSVTLHPFSVLIPFSVFIPFFGFYPFPSIPVSIHFFDDTREYIHQSLSFVQTSQMATISFFFSFYPLEHSFLHAERSVFFSCCFCFHFFIPWFHHSLQFSIYDGIILYHFLYTFNPLSFFAMPISIRYANLYPLCQSLSAVMSTIRMRYVCG